MSPAGDLIATCSGEFNGWVFNAKTGEVVQYLDHGMTGDCFEAFFSPDGRFVCTIAGHMCFVRRVCDMWPLRPSARSGVVEDEAPVVFEAIAYCVAFSSGGLCALATGSIFDSDEHPREVQVVSIDADQHMVATILVTSCVVSLQFDPSRSSLLMVLVKNGSPALWRATDGTCLHTFGDMACDSVIWAPDGVLVAASYADGKVRVWHIEDGNCVHVFDGAGQVTCVSLW